MKKAAKKATDYLNNCIKFKFSRKMDKDGFMNYVGITQAEFNDLLAGNLLLDKERFYKMLSICKEYDYSNSNYPEYFKKIPNWALVSMIEPVCSLVKTNGERINYVQAIIDMPFAIIDDYDLCISENDFLLYPVNASREDRLLIEKVTPNYAHESAPAYVLGVRRCETNMEEAHVKQIIINNNNRGINIGDTVGSNTVETINNPMSCFKEIISWLRNMLKGLFGKKS